MLWVVQLVVACVRLTKFTGTPMSDANCERRALPKTIEAVILGKAALLLLV